MKKIILSLWTMAALQAGAQLTANILLPVGGVMDKQQLWNIMVTNTYAYPVTIQVQVNFSERAGGQPVFSATTSPFTVNPGTQQLSASSIGAVQYNILNPSYQMDGSPTGLLPFGSFMACYDFIGGQHNAMLHDCQPVEIPPLGPLTLIQPANGSTISDLYPGFHWLPPSPVNGMSLRFDMRLVEILSGQSPADALQQNIPLYTAHALVPNNLLYTPSMPALAVDRQYAWQVVALNNLSEIARSETWSFRTASSGSNGILPKADPVYIKVRKAGLQEGNAVFFFQLRFDYLNETSDTTWNISVQDLSAAGQTSFPLVPDSVRLKRGQNLVSYPADTDARFADKHQYLLSIKNSRGEISQLRFEFRKPKS